MRSNASRNRSSDSTRSAPRSSTRPGLDARILALLLLAPTALAASDAHVDATVQPEPHPSILVEGNAAFAHPLSGVSSGTGTADDPYVIQNLSVAHTAGYAIRLSNTTAHVLITDVVVPGIEGRAIQPAACLVDPNTCTGAIGVDLVNAENVTIRRLRIVAEAFGIVVRSSQRVGVYDTAIGDATAGALASGFGVYAPDSRDLTIEGLETVRTTIPLRIARSGAVTVDASSFRAPGSHAYVDDVTGFTLRGSVFEGIYLDFGGVNERLEISSNTFTDAPYGLLVTGFQGQGVYDATFCGNSFKRIGTTAIGALTIGQGSGVQILGNRFEDNGIGFELARTIGTVFERNLVANSTRFGANVGRYDAHVHNNSFVDNAGATFLGAGTDGRFNWWGDASGPSGHGPGEGDAVEINAANTTFHSWQTSAPDLRVDCEAAATKGTGPTTVPRARVEGHAAASADEGVHDVRVRVDEDAHVEVEATGAQVLP